MFYSRGNKILASAKGKRSPGGGKLQEEGNSVGSGFHQAMQSLKNIGGGIKRQGRGLLNVLMGGKKKNGSRGRKTQNKKRKG